MRPEGATEKELVTAALIGTGRRAVPDLFWNDLVADASPVGLDTTDSGGLGPTTPEQELLDAAAAYDLVRRVGRPLVPAGPRRVAPAAPETTALLPTPVLRAVELLVQPHDFTPEQVASLLGVVVAHANGRRLPPDLVPDLLDRLLSWRVPVPGLGELLGERGQWLLDARPKWTRLRTQVATGAAARVVEDLPEDWESRWPQDRVDDGQALLRVARNERPREAAASLEQHLITFKAKDRATLLRTLEVGLSVEDESLLTRALGDSASGVRSVAIELLDRIPQGQRGARFADRLRPLLVVHGPLRRKLRVDLPEAPDAQGIADGLPAPGAGAPDRRAWLTRLIHGAPLATWTQATGRTPAQTLGMLGEAWVVKEIIAIAALRGDADWADALLGQGTEADPLVAVASPVRRQEHVLTLLTGSTPANRVVKVLRDLPTPWPDVVADRALDVMLTGAFDHHLRGIRDLFTAGIGPHLLPKVRRLLDPEGAGDPVPPDHRAVLSAVLQFHSFHHSLLEALR